MKETLKISDRFNLAKKLGQGTFSYIYEAYDKVLDKNVALKIEKKDKNKSILIFEYNVLKLLKGITQVCNVYDFVKNSEQNLIVMDLLGNNLAKVRKCLEENYNGKIAVQLLIEMLDAIEKVHERGFIHRDVKASNFVLSRDNKQLFIVDFGLAKKHLDERGNPVPHRKRADFRGTVSFASLNAHNNIDLSRRDDLWSLYFVILDFLNEKLKWREQKEYTMDQVKKIKTQCFNNPEEKLWIATKDIEEVKVIFYHLRNLSYYDKPNYELIRHQLKSILNRFSEMTPQQQIMSFESTLASTPQQFAISQNINDLQQPPRQTIGQPLFYDNNQDAEQRQQRKQREPQDYDVNNLNPQEQLPRPQALGKASEIQKPGAIYTIKIDGQEQKPAKRVTNKRKNAAAPTELQQNVISEQNNHPVFQIQIENINDVKQKKAAQPKKRDSKKNKPEPNQLGLVSESNQQQPPLGQEFAQPTNNNLLYHNLSSVDSNYINQQISICQNFFLTPQILLLLNDQQNQSQLYTSAATQAALSQPGLLPTQLTGFSSQQLRPSMSASGLSMISQAANLTQFPQAPNQKGLISSENQLQQQQQQQQQSLMNMSLQQQANIFKKFMPTPAQLNQNRDSPILQEPILSLREDDNPLQIEAKITNRRIQSQQVKSNTKANPKKATTKQTQSKPAPGAQVYQYNPQIFESVNKPIFAIQKTRNPIMIPSQSSKQQSIVTSERNIQSRLRSKGNQNGK